MSARQPWHKIPGETRHSRRAFRCYLEMGPMRSIRRVSAQIGKHRTTIDRWSSRFNWVARADEYDEWLLNRAIEKRAQVVEAAIAKMQTEALEVTDTIIDLARGRMQDGDTVPVFDKFGNEIGDRPAVPAAVRMQAAVRAQECAGIIPPKRVEMSGLDGGPVEAAIEVVHRVNDDELRALIELTEKFEVVDDGDGDEPEK